MRSGGQSKKCLTNHLPRDIIKSLRGDKAQEKGKIKMKTILAILRAMLADETPYMPDVYNVQSFGANGLF